MREFWAKFRIPARVKIISEEIRYKFSIIKEAVCEMPEDIIRFFNWIHKKGSRFASDWYCFTSSISVVSIIPFIFGFKILILSEMVYPTKWFSNYLELLYDFLFMYMTIAIIGVIGLYAVRTWERIRNIIIQPVNYDDILEEIDGDLKQKSSHSDRNISIKKYKYWVWSFFVCATFTFFFLTLERLGYNITECTSPISFPSFIYVFSRETSTVWFIDGIQSFATGLNLGETIVLLFIFMIPCALVALGAKVHIDQTRNRITKYNLVNILFRELLKTVWSVIAILLTYDYILTGSI